MLASLQQLFGACPTRQICALATLSIIGSASAQNLPFPTMLSRDEFRSGEATLQVLAPLSAALRHSIVKIDVDEEIMALGTVIDTNGLAITKASELKPGKLTCWLATDKEVEAEVIAIDEDEDIALIKVHASGLKPINWSTDKVVLGEWAITPGIAQTPQAMGIVSALPRRIRPQRAFIGVTFDNTEKPTILDLMPGFSAEKAGLKQGDVILEVNSTPVTNRMQVVEMLRELREGQSVRLSVQRENEKIEAEMELMAPKSGPLAAMVEPPPRSSRMNGQVSRRAQDFQQVFEHDTTLQPWLCGGPVVDLDGKGIGLNIARAGRVSTYALTAELVQKIIERLKAKAAAPAS